MHTGKIGVLTFSSENETYITLTLSCPRCFNTKEHIKNTSTTRKPLCVRVAWEYIGYDRRSLDLNTYWPVSWGSRCCHCGDTRCSGTHSWSWRAGTSCRAETRSAAKLKGQTLTAQLTVDSGCVKVRVRAFCSRMPTGQAADIGNQTQDHSGLQIQQPSNYTTKILFNNLEDLQWICFQVHVLKKQVEVRTFCARMPTSILWVSGFEIKPFSMVESNTISSALPCPSWEDQRIDELNLRTLCQCQRCPRWTTSCTEHTGAPPRPAAGRSPRPPMPSGCRPPPSLLLPCPGGRYR